MGTVTRVCFYLTPLDPEVPGHWVPRLDPRELVLSQFTARGVKELPPRSLLVSTANGTE